MKTRTPANQIDRRAWWFAAWLALMFLAPALGAQPAARHVDNRFLLVFDNSTEMKRRLPAVRKALDTILATSVNQQLHPGDSLGVWTFDQTLHAGQFPLQPWDPDHAAMIASNITTFVSQQHYVKTTSFAAMQTALDRVVLGSERLTVLIFCDGAGEIHGTPYDTGINQIFKQRQTERQKARAPIVIGLRSQRGQYIGCMVSFPPQAVSLPAFPPLPEPVPVPPPVTNVPPPPPPVPPLIIIGTKHESKPPAPPPPASTNLAVPKALPAPQSLPPQSAVQSTNSLPPPSAQPAPAKTTAELPSTQTAVALAGLEPPVARTNIVAGPAGNSAPGANGGLILAVVLMAVAVGLVFFMWRRSQTPPASLITRSMNEEKKSLRP